MAWKKTGGIWGNLWGFPGGRPLWGSQEGGSPRDMERPRGFLRQSSGAARKRHFMVFSNTTSAPRCYSLAWVGHRELSMGRCVFVVVLRMFQI